MRTVECVCGGTITAPSLAQSGPYVEAHGWTGLHRLWRAQNEGWCTFPVIPPQFRDDPRRERPTATQPGASEATSVRRGSAPAPAGASASPLGGRS